MRSVWGRRSDAKLVRDLSATRRFMPYLSRRRNSSLVYYKTQIEVGPALQFLEEQNRGRSKSRPITLFHVYLQCLVLALHERPGVNRFVEGGRLWQRDGIWITFSAKQEIADGSPVLTLKRRFDPSEDLISMVDSLLDELEARRGGRHTTADREVDLALRLPGPLITTGMFLLRAANRFGLLPRSMIDGDPMFTSVFVANLGSVGLDAGYHHLWEYGTCSIFAVLGRVRSGAGGGALMDVRYSYDERVEDGLYAAITMKGIQDRFGDPSRLLHPVRRSSTLAQES
ncbi:hypothetical protein MK280_13780 [Myxococcota bacterium]|nr:hypothetical protein [Myxococcota bacterium]